MKVPQYAEAVPLSDRVKIFCDVCRHWRQAEVITREGGRKVARCLMCKTQTSDDYNWRNPKC